MRSKPSFGTVDIDYQNIPFFSAYDVFDDERLNVLEANRFWMKFPSRKLYALFENTPTHVGSVYHLIESFATNRPSGSESAACDTRTDCRCRVSDPPCFSCGEQFEKGTFPSI